MDEWNATDRSSQDCWLAPHSVAHITAAMAEAMADTDIIRIITEDMVATGIHSIH